MPISAAGTHTVGRRQVNHFEQALSGARSAAQPRFFRSSETGRHRWLLPRRENGGERCAAVHEYSSRPTTTRG